MDAGRKQLTAQKIVEASEEYCGITIFRHENEVEIIPSIGIAYKLENINGAIKTKAHYKVYPINFGCGKNLQKFLVTDPNETKPIGTNRLYIRPIEVKDDKIEYLSTHWLERPVLEKICKEARISTEVLEEKETRQATVPEIIDRIVERQEENPFFFAETTGIPEEEMEKISDANWHIMIHDYLFEGLPKDPLIELTYKSDLIEPNPSLIRPALFQPFNSHELVFTNSKTSKTSTAKKTGIQVDSARPANLLGFGTANEKVEGSLNKQTKQLTLDEIEEEESDEIFASLNTYLEQGETEVRKGKAKVNVEGYAGIRWQGNPKPSKEHEQTIDTDYFDEEDALKYLYQNFSDCLGIISRNNEAFGGRIAHVMFRSDLMQIKNKKDDKDDKKEKTETKDALGVLPLKTLQKNHAVVTAVLRKARDNYTKLYFDEDVLTWLNQGFNKSYDDAIKQIANKIKLLNLREFIEGHRDLAGRHARGKALKLACVDMAPQLMKGTLDKEELKELANEYQQQIEQQNLESFANLVTTASKDSTIQEYLKESFKELPLHLKMVLEAMKKAFEVQGTIETALDSLKSEFPVKSETGYAPERIIQRTIKNMTRTNKMITKFGVVLEGDSENPIIKVKDSEKLKQGIGVDA